MWPFGWLADNKQKQHEESRGWEPDYTLLTPWGAPATRSSTTPSTSVDPERCWRGEGASRCNNPAQTDIGLCLHHFAELREAD